MTIRELRNLTRLKQLPDQWWLAVNNEVFEEKIRLIDLEMRQARLKNKEVYVLNADVAYLERDWTKVDFVGLHLYGKEKLPKTTQPKASTRSKIDPVKDESRSRLLSELSMNDLPENTHTRKLADKEKELKALEKELKEREDYVRQSEEALIRRSYLHELKEAELEQLSDDNISVV